MIVSPILTELAEAYEQEHGQKPSEPVLHIVEHIQQVGRLLKDQGRKDAQQGNNAYSANAFSMLVVKAFHLDAVEDRETVQAIAALWQDDYMSAFASVK